ncbi:hypothetical protein ABIB29_003534 [Arthrobacter sp. UYEF36]
MGVYLGIRVPECPCGFRLLLPGWGRAVVIRQPTLGRVLHPLGMLPATPRGNPVGRDIKTLAVPG